MTPVMCRVHSGVRPLLRSSMWSDGCIRAPIRVRSTIPRGISKLVWIATPTRQPGWRPSSGKRTGVRLALPSGLPCRRCTVWPVGLRRLSDTARPSRLPGCLVATPPSGLPLLGRRLGPAALDSLLENDVALLLAVHQISPTSLPMTRRSLPGTLKGEESAGS